MAGDWIKMRADLHTHPKVVRISSALKADRLRTVGGLHAVWCLFDAHSDDGQLDGYTLEAIDDLIGWPGFAGAMLAVGWVELGDEFVRLPRFDEHNSRSAKRRALETERKRRDRESVTDDRKLSAPHADGKRTREEKRRVDIPTTEVVGGDEPKKRATRRCPDSFDLTEAMREWAVEHAPAVDVDLATAKFRDHTFRTAITDWPAAWRNWLRKDQEFAQSRPTASRKPGGESFRERDERIARERASEFIGRPSRKSDSDHGDVIDVTPVFSELEFEP